MEQTQVKIRNLKITVYSLNTVIVGSGAAGLNAADRLHALGQTDIALVTEGMNKGTSRNTGSDKQTYYKLTLAGNTVDSVYDMAETLFNGGAMHGDIALVEAADFESEGDWRLECLHKVRELLYDDARCEAPKDGLPREDL